MVMWLPPHNEWDHDTVPVSGEDRSWNNQQIHAEVLRAGQYIMEWKIQVSQAWLYGGYSTQETAQGCINTQEKRSGQSFGFPWQLFPFMPCEGSEINPPMTKKS